MTNTNLVVLIGNLTKDPITNTDGTLCRFTIAVNGYQDKTSFPQIKCFTKTAELCAKYLKKGSKVCVTGSIETGSYDKGDTKVYTTDVVARNVEFLTPKGEHDSEFKKSGKTAEDNSNMEPLDDNLMPF